MGERGIKIGERNNTLRHFVIGWHKLGWGVSEILSAVHNMNDVQCVVSLPAAEIERIVQDVVNPVFTSKDLAFSWSAPSETETNEKGGKQARLNARFDLICPFAMQVLAEVLARGAKKYGVDNWKLISVDGHLNHALYHIYRYLSPDEEPLSVEAGENHLAHAFCRMMMAVSQKG